MRFIDIDMTVQVTAPDRYDPNAAAYSKDYLAENRLTFICPICKTESEEVFCDSCMQDYREHVMQYAKSHQVNYSDVLEMGAELYEREG